MSLELIESCIECPLMDSKNISKIIYSYIKYNIFDISDVYSVKIEFSTDYISNTEYIYCCIYDVYYLLYLHHSSLKLINGIMCLNDDPKNSIPIYENTSLESLEKFLFIKELDFFCNKKNYFNSYEVLKRFKNKEECQKYLKKELITYKKLLINGLFPSSNNGYDNLMLWYNNEIIFNVYNNNDNDNEEEENQEFSIQLIQKGKELENMIYKIINLL